MLACWHVISRESNANINQIFRVCQSFNFFIYTPKKKKTLISRHPITTNCHCCMTSRAKRLTHAYTKKRDLKFKPKTGTLIKAFCSIAGQQRACLLNDVIMKSALILCLPLILLLINLLTYHVIWCNFSI